LPTQLPIPPKKFKVKPPSSPSEPVTPAVSLKRIAPEDDDIVEQPSKRLKKSTDDGKSEPLASPRKRKLLEEEGIVMLDNLDDRLEYDVIEID
jgi:ubiquitin-like 1-activating enzyme E1 B